MTANAASNTQSCMPGLRPRDDVLLVYCSQELIILAIKSNDRIMVGTRRLSCKASYANSRSGYKKWKFDGMSAPRRSSSQRGQNTADIWHITPTTRAQKCRNARAVVAFLTSSHTLSLWLQPGTSTVEWGKPLANIRRRKAVEIRCSRRSYNRCRYLRKKCHQTRRNPGRIPAHTMFCARTTAHTTYKGKNASAILKRSSF